MVFHSNQVETARNILESTTRYNVLSAQMQSGKTGTSLYYAFQMLKMGKCQRTIIMTGSRDTALREQWEENVESHLEEFAPTTKEFRAMSKKVSVYFGQDLEKVDSAEIADSVIIWDESHYGQTKDQTLFTFFSRMGIYTAIKGQNESLDEKNIFILSVSATPAAEISSIHYDETPQDKTIFQLPAGEGYKGMREYHSANLIKLAPRVLPDNKPKLARWISQYIGRNKYMVIRAQNSKKVNSEAILREVCEELGIPYFIYDGEHKDILGKFDTAPEQFTLIHIKGMLRMGKELPKAHICALAETAQEINTDTCLQGLPGRGCGYHSEDIDIYVPRCFLKTGLIEYINFLEHGTGLSKCMMIKGKRTIIRTEDGRTPIVPIHIRGQGLQIPETSTEAKDHASDVLRVLLENPSLDGENDPVQMAEVRQLIEAGLEDNSLLMDNLRTYRITSSDWEQQYFDVQKKHKANVPRKHNTESALGICYVTCDVEFPSDSPASELDLYKKGDIWVFAYTYAKDPSFQFGPAFFEPNKKTIFMDKSEQGFDEEVTAQTITMNKEVTTQPESFVTGLRRMITLSLEETDLKVTRSISANGENPNLLISKEHYKIGSHFDDKNNQFIRALQVMEQEFSGIAIKFKRVKPKAGYWAIKEISW
jgi:hypothetical protein